MWPFFFPHTHTHTPECHNAAVADLTPHMCFWNSAALWLLECNKDATLLCHFKIVRLVLIYSDNTREDEFIFTSNTTINNLCSFWTSSQSLWVFIWTRFVDVLFFPSMSEECSFCHPNSTCSFRLTKVQLLICAGQPALYSCCSSVLMWKIQLMADCSVSFLEFLLSILGGLDLL